MFTACGFQAIPADGKSRAGRSHRVAVGVATPTLDVVVTRPAVRCSMFALRAERGICQCESDTLAERATRARPRHPATVHRVGGTCNLSVDLFSPSLSHMSNVVFSHC